MVEAGRSSRPQSFLRFLRSLTEMSVLEGLAGLSARWVEAWRMDAAGPLAQCGLYARLYQRQFRDDPADTGARSMIANL